MAETGLPGFEFSAWKRVLVPRGTPPAIVDLPNRKLRETLADPVVLARFGKGGIDPVATRRASTPSFCARSKRNGGA